MQDVSEGNEVSLIQNLYKLCSLHETQVLDEMLYHLCFDETPRTVCTLRRRIVLREVLTNPRYEQALLDACMRVHQDPDVLEAPMLRVGIPHHLMFSASRIILAHVEAWYDQETPEDFLEVAASIRNWCNLLRGNDHFSCEAFRALCVHACTEHETRRRFKEIL